MNAGKKHLMWIAELLIWFVILALIAGSLVFARYQYKKSIHTYQIFLPDVDGIIVGSPVRLMGIQVGYVNRIKIIQDDVYVKFLITEENFEIPKGTIATVEFTGLGGSKSLELYPPNKQTKRYDKLIVIQRPKRIHDSLGLLNDMFEKVSSIAYRFSFFFEETGVIKTNVNLPKIKGASGIDNYVNESDKWLDEKIERQKIFENKLKELKK